MCGIVGIAGNMNASHRDAFKDMLMVCQVRGRDSTGAFKVGGGNKAVVVKRVGTPEILLDSMAFDRNIDTNDAKVLVGHCRAKTVGEASVANAHPFSHNGLTGVHNGTLRWIYGKERKEDFGTDSEWLYWHASEYGMEETISDLDADDAWALVWWNEKDNTLNFLRNDKRPLWFTYSKDMKVMLWASEIWMFGAFHRRHELWDGGEKGQVYVQLPVNEMVTYSVNGYGREAKDVFTINRIKKITGREVRRNTGNVNAGNHGGTGSNPHLVVTRANTGGGEVSSPFLKATEIGQTLRDRQMQTLKESLGSTAETNPEKLKEILDLNDPLPEELESSQEKKATTSQTTPPSPSSSQKSTDSSTESNTSNKSRTRTLSLVQTTSTSSATENNGAGCVNSPVSAKRVKQHQLDFRSIAGVSYITDRKSGKEWSEQAFDEETGGVCCWCKAPVGDLKEVSEIFVKTVQNAKEEIVTFLCTSCDTAVDAA